MLTGGFAFRVAARGYLRHVDDDFDTAFHCSLRKLSGRLHQAGADRIAEVGPLHSAQCGTHRVEVEEVAKHDLSAGYSSFLSFSVKLPRAEDVAESIKPPESARVARPAAKICQRAISNNPAYGHFTATLAPIAFRPSTQLASIKIAASPAHLRLRSTT
jgi:hypothetical protein